MSWIPAAIALLMVFIMVVYPLTKSKMKEIGRQLVSLQRVED